MRGWRQLLIIFEQWVILVDNYVKNVVEQGWNIPRITARTLPSLFVLYELIRLFDKSNLGKRL